jgi:hypothetical protein
MAREESNSKIWKDYATRCAAPNEQRCNLYIEDMDRPDLLGKGAQMKFRVNTEARDSLAEFTRMVTQYPNTCVYYAWPHKQTTCIRLAITTKYSPSLVQDYVDYDSELARIVGGNEPVTSTADYDSDGSELSPPSSPPPPKRIRSEPTLTGQALMHKNLRIMVASILAPMLMQHKKATYEQHGEFKKLANSIVYVDCSKADDFYIVFPEVWMAISEIQKLAFIFNWHPRLKDIVTIQIGQKNMFPLPGGSVSGYKPVDEPITPHLVDRTFLIPQGSHAPTLMLSNTAKKEMESANSAFEAWKQAQIVMQEAPRAGVRADPFNSESVIDLESPDLMNAAYLRRIFNPAAPDCAFYYINQFIADVYQKGQVWMKVRDDITRTTKLECYERGKFPQQVFSFMNYEQDTEGPDGKMKTVKGNIIKFWLEHPSHRLFEGTTFEPGNPTVIVLDTPTTDQDAYLSKVMLLNTCPPATYFTYSQLFLDKNRPPGLTRITPSVIFNGANPDVYFDRRPDEPLISTFMRKAKDLPKLNSSDPALDDKAEEEGADMVLWVLLFHIFYVICNGDMHLFERFNAFFARILFKPMDQDRQFIVIKGHQGSGKSNVVNFMGTRLFGEGTQYHFLGGQSSRLAGKFASQFDNAVLVTLDEAVIGKDMETMNTFKSICTDRIRTTEAKFRESKLIRNYLHCIFICNQCELPVEPGDRRYIFLECNSELGYISEYHAKLQPRIASMYTMMVYGRYLQLRPELLNNDHVNFYKAPPMTIAKERCLLARLSLMNPELAWWEGCLKDRKVRLLSGNQNVFTHEVAWFETWAPMLNRLKIPIAPNDVKQTIANAKSAYNLDKDTYAELDWISREKDQKYLQFHKIWSGAEDDNWPVETTWEDLYNAFKAQVKNSKLLPSEFIESISGCVTVKSINANSANQQHDDMMSVRIRLPCLYGCRAQFKYFLKYNCVRDKDHFYHARGSEYTQFPEVDDVDISVETWITILRQQARVGGRPETFHRHCQHCRKTSKLWAEVDPERAAEDPEPEATVQQHPREESRMESSHAENQRVHPVHHGQGDEQRGGDTCQGQPPLDKGKGRLYDRASDDPLDSVQPGCGGLEPKPWPRIQDLSREDYTPPGTPPDRSQPLSPGADFYDVRSASGSDSMDSDSQ